MKWQCLMTSGKGFQDKTPRCRKKTKVTCRRVNAVLVNADRLFFSIAITNTFDAFNRSNSALLWLYTGCPCAAPQKPGRMKTQWVDLPLSLVILKKTMYLLGGSGIRAVAASIRLSRQNCSCDFTDLWHSYVASLLLNCGSAAMLGMRSCPHMFYSENQPDPSPIFHGDLLSVMMRESVVSSNVSVVFITTNLST